MSLIVEGRAKALERDRKAQAWAAWHTAYLTAYAPTKSREFIKLDEFMVGGKAPRAATPDDTLAAALQWHARVSSAA